MVNDVRLWMEHDKRLLNDDKTEFLILGTRQQLLKINISSITVGSSRVERSSVVKNLGTFLDDKLSMNAHIIKTKSVMYHFTIFIISGALASTYRLTLRRL